MFGLTLEKMIIIGLIAAVLIGPQRLPMYAQKLSELIRTFRAFAEASRVRAESELGMPLNTAEWNSQLRQYDPRRIVRDAWTASPQAATSGAQDAVPDATSDAAAADLETASTTETADPPEVETRVRWEIVGGTSGHPIRRRVVETVPVTVPVADPAADPVSDVDESTPTSSDEHLNARRTVDLSA